MPRPSYTAVYQQELRRRCAINAARWRAAVARRLSCRAYFPFLVALREHFRVEGVADQANANHHIYGGTAIRFAEATFESGGLLHNGAEDGGGLHFSRGPSSNGLSRDGLPDRVSSSLPFFSPQLSRRVYFPDP